MFVWVGCWNLGEEARSTEAFVKDLSIVPSTQKGRESRNNSLSQLHGKTSLVRLIGAEI